MIKRLVATLLLLGVSVYGVSLTVADCESYDKKRFDANPPLNNSDINLTVAIKRGNTVTYIGKSNRDSKMLFHTGDQFDILTSSDSDAYLIIIANMKDANGEYFQYIINNNEGDLETKIGKQENFLFNGIEIYPPEGSEVMQFVATKKSIVEKLSDALEKKCIATGNGKCTEYPYVFIEDVSGKEIFNGIVVDNAPATRGAMCPIIQKNNPDEVRFYYISKPKSEK